MPDASIEIRLNQQIGTINPNIYGHFMEHLGSCIDQGCWVGRDSKIPNTNGIRNDVVEALHAINAPVIRWPGGCFADDYHWRDGIGPVLNRPQRINIHWGNVIEDNHFGTHEFMEFCNRVGTTPYFSGNVGSGTPQEMRDWVEYCNFSGESSLAQERAANGSKQPFDVKYWGVGNENWGCGGNFTPEDYATEYRRFSTYLRDWGTEPNYLIACGPNGNDLDWTRRVLDKILKGYLPFNPPIHGLSAHYYCGTAGTDLSYTNDQWYELLWKSLKIETLVTEQRALLDEFDPERKIGLLVDEWGTWHPPTPGKNSAFLYQQNTVRDALVAALTLNIFNNHADKLVMANIAQTINVLQALLLTDEDKMIKTPTYHVYDLYQPHKGAVSMKADVESPSINFTMKDGEQSLPAVSCSASMLDNTLTITLVNVNHDSPLSVEIKGLGQNFSSVRGDGLNYADGDIHAHNSFDSTEVVGLKPLNESEFKSGTGVYTIAPASVTRLMFTN